MSVLHKFSQLLGGTNPKSEPFKISAGKLDHNFQACSPIPQDGDPDIKVTQSADGWTVELKKSLDELTDARIPEPPTSGTYVLGSINGAIQWIATENC
jgi:hypothetical protein